MYQVTTILEVASIAFGLLSAATGFSISIYALIHSVRDQTLRKASVTYARLLTDMSVTDSDGVQSLLRIMRSNFERFDSPELSKYGLLRRWRETVTLKFAPGKIEQRENFVGVNPVYGYDVKGDETLVADHSVFYQAYTNYLTGQQQKAAFMLLLLAFFFQLLVVVAYPL